MRFAVVCTLGVSSCRGIALTMIDASNVVFAIVSELCVTASRLAPLFASFLVYGTERVLGATSPELLNRVKSRKRARILAVESSNLLHFNRRKTSHAPLSVTGGLFTEFAAYNSK